MMRKDIVMTVLSNHAEVIMGQSPPGNSYGSNKSGMPLLNGADDLTKTGIKPKKYTSAPKKTSKKNDILLCIRATIGNLQYSDGVYCLGRGVAAIRLKNTTLNSEYLIWGLQNKIEYIKQRAKGTTIVGLRKEDLTGFEIPLFPISEQRAIVAKIEELFSDLDKGVADLKKAQDQLKVYRQAVLKKAFEGDWEIKLLDEVAKWGSGGTPSRSNKRFYSGNIPWIKTGELGDKYISSSEEKITDEAIKKSSAKIFPPGSVAIAMYGATIGKTSIFSNYLSTNQACAVGQPIDGMVSEYLYYYLLSQKMDFINKGKGGAQPNISQTILKKHPIPVPLKEQQVKIIQMVESRLSICDKVGNYITESLEKAEALRQSILKKAFEGNLLSTKEIEKCKTASDYEPAEVLLKKIKLEKK